jgi:hypothetical protein
VPSSINSTGTCAIDNTLRLPDAGFGKSCHCTHPDTADCPVDQDAGIYSFCKAGVYPSVCIRSMVCAPSPGGAYRPVTNGGCGL